MLRVNLEKNINSPKVTSTSQLSLFKCSTHCQMMTIKVSTKPLMMTIKVGLKALHVVLVASRYVLNDANSLTYRPILFVIYVLMLVSVCG